MRNLPSWSAAFLFPLVLACQADAASLLASDFAGNLWDLDPATGAVLSQRSTGVLDLVGLSFSPDGTLYGLSGNGTGTAHPNSLYQIDPGTGAATLIGDLGIPISAGDIAVDPKTGVIYGTQGFAGVGGPLLFTVDPHSGAATILGNPGLEGAGLAGMAFDKSGTLYVLNAFGATLLKIDKANGQIVNTLPIDFFFGEEAGISFDPSTGKLYAAGNLPGANGRFNLDTIDVTTGAVTPVVPIDLEVEGLAFVPASTPPLATPEPAGLAPFGAGLLGLLWLRHRRNRPPSRSRHVPAAATGITGSRV